MSGWEIVRHAVAITGRVIDGQTARPIGGAQVAITNGPAVFMTWLAARAKQYGAQWPSMKERPDLTRAAADGHFHFMDLPDGQYTLTVSLPGVVTRYGTAQKLVTVSRDAQGHIIIATAEIALPPTTLKGQIAGQGNNPVAMAEVRVKGSGERGFSNDQGQYVLVALEAGERTVRVSARGYDAAEQTVLLGSAGTVKTLDFTLVPFTP